MDATESFNVVSPEPSAAAAAAAREEDGIDAAFAPRARTGTVLGLLVTAAAVLSYFIAFPLTNALRAAEFLTAPAAAGHDPRMRLMAVTFASLLGGFAVMAGLFRLVNKRQMRRIDAMLEA